MTHSVNLAVGMTAIRRDGERVGPLKASGHHVYKFTDGRCGWMPNGSVMRNHLTEIIAAGFPWTDLGAQAGDTVRRVWNGNAMRAVEWEFVLTEDGHPQHPDSLYVIVAKPADRLNLRDGEDRWSPLEKIIFAARAREAAYRARQDADMAKLAELVAKLEPELGGPARIVAAEQKPRTVKICTMSGGSGGAFPEQKPDEVIVRYGKIGHFIEPLAELTSWVKQSDTHRLTITFPHGSNVGTAVKEKL